MFGVFVSVVALAGCCEVVKLLVVVIVVEWEVMVIGRRA